MIIDLLYLIAITMGFYFTGLSLNMFWTFYQPKGPDKTLTILLGQSAILSISFLIVFLNLEPKVILYAWLVLVIVGIQVFIRKQLINSICPIEKPRSSLFLMIPALAVIAISNNSFLDGLVRFRNGPDIFGWITSAQHLCAGKTITILKTEIMQETGAKSLGQVFNLDPHDPSKIGLPLNQIPSVRSQYSGEFLIGNRRLGIPGFESAICRVLNSESVFHTSNALSALSILLLSVISYKFLLRFNLSMKVSVAYSLLAASNFGVLSVLFEGGFVQIVSLPYFLILIYYLTERTIRIQRLVLPLAGAIAFSFSTYADLNFVILLMLSLILFSQNFQLRQEWIVANRKRHFIEKKINFWEYARAELGITDPLYSKINLFAFVLLICLLVETFKNLLYRVGSSGIRGGWDFGRFPDFVNVLGIVDWVPKDGRSGISRSAFIYLIELVITIVCYKIYSYSNRDQQVMFRSIFVCILAVLVVNYGKINQPHNSYAVWKLGAYLSPLFWIYVAPAMTIHSRKGWRLQEIIKFTLVISGIFSLLTWSANYFKYSQSSYGKPSISIVKYINKSDIYFKGREGVGAGSAAFVALGDVHFLNPSHKRSSPERPLVYITLTELCKKEPEATKSCLKREFGLLKNEELELLEVAPPFNIFKMSSF